MADVRVRVIGEDQASQTLKGIDGSLKSFGNSFTELQSKLSLAREAVNLFAGTFQQAFEMGEQGAQVIQTAASFEMLTEKVGASTNLLEQLRSASKGTISDMQLMSSTATLLAGAQGKLASSLADATPQLLEIAKAAQKLNPTLGDTNFMYESLALGVKRASPMILDNLGLTIKLEEAYTKYAESLGKSAQELTVEEQKIALLNEVMRAGDVLIEQVGGTTDSATDSFARFKTATQNAVDVMKANLAPALADAADALSTLVAWNDNLAATLEQHAQEVSSTAKSYEEYVTELQRAAEVAGYSINAEGDLVKTRKEGAVTIERVIQNNYLMLESEYLITQAKERNTAAEEAYTAMMERHNAVVEEQVVAREKLLKVLRESAVGVDAEVMQRTDAFTAQMTALREEYEKLQGAMLTLQQEGIEPTDKKFSDLQEQLGKVSTKMQDLDEQTRKATAQLIYQKLAAKLTDEAALNLARSLGLLSQQDYDLILRIDELTKKFDLNADEILNAQEATTEYNEAILELVKETYRGITANADYEESLNRVAESTDKVSDAEYRLNSIQSALNAAISGSLTKSFENYTETMRANDEESERLMQQYIDLVNSGVYSGEVLDNLAARMKQLQEETVAARDAMKLATAEMIYQQAAAGLDAEAALNLARTMGLISESDYAVAIALQRLRAQYDANRDGAISAAEGANEYAQAVANLNRIVQAYQVQGTAITEDLLNQSLGTFGGSGAAMPSTVTQTVNALSFQVTYSPTLSTAAAYELESAIKPVIDNILIAHGLI